MKETSTDQIRKFLNTAERRELKGKRAFSRSYWTKQHRPRLKVYLYQAMVKLLCDNKLILNRGERRSGNMTLTPNQCIDRIKNNMIDPLT